MVTSIPANLLKDFLINNIERVLKENSGGVKITELICAITSRLCSNNYDIPENLVSIIYSIIDDRNDIGIISYASDTANSRSKELHFVFFKLIID